MHWWFRRPSCSRNKVSNLLLFFCMHANKLAGFEFIAQSILRRQFENQRYTYDPLEGQEVSICTRNVYLGRQKMLLQNDRKSNS